MSFRWDWLRPAVTVPFVPTIGPVHPSVLAECLFADILRVAATGDLLPYDKDMRWFAVKDETVLADDLVHGRDGTLIPTLSRRGSGTVRVYVYEKRPDTFPSVSDVARRVAAECGVADARVVRFHAHDAPSGSGARVQLEDFTATECPRPSGPVRYLDGTSRSDERTFAAFADEMDADGFAFLHGRMKRGGVGPILVAVVDERVVGAIGPMEVRPDAAGAPQLMPPYFGVLPGHRGNGLGRLLSRAAMHWGQSHGAAYQLLQTAVGSASDHLFQTEGLTPLGFIHSQPL